MARERWSRSRGGRRYAEPDGRCVGGVWQGIRVDLEDKADEVIFDHLASLKASEKTDVLTPWKYYKRGRHQTLVGGYGVRLPDSGVTGTAGAPDRAVLEGVFRREANPLHSYLNGKPRGTTATGRTELGAALGVGPVFGVSLNTPSLWIDPKCPRLPNSATGVKDQPDTAA